MCMCVGGCVCVCACVRAHVTLCVCVRGQSVHASRATNAWECVCVCVVWCVCVVCVCARARAYKTNAGTDFRRRRFIIKKYIKLIENPSV